MRRLVLTLIFALFIFSPTLGQDKKEQLLLRGVLGVSQNTPIDFKAAGGLPENRPLRIYLTTNTETTVRNNFLDWFKEWNQRDGLKYGLIEVVTVLSTADIAVVRFTDSVVQMTDAVVTYDTSTEIDPATRKPISTPTLPRATKLAVDVYGYVVAIENGKLKVLRRYTDTAVVNSTIRTLTGGSMQDLTRAQAEVTRAVNEGTFNSKARKDSKVAGDKLRDELFKLLRARRVNK